MSISMDDLVATLASNHIGQEAIELAALHTQLAQTLFNHHLPSTPSDPSSSTGRSQNIAISRDTGVMQPCNTPTTRTPMSNSFSWSSSQVMSDPTHRRNSSAASAKFSRRTSADDCWFDMVDDNEAEERMVEDLLHPSSPQSPGPQPVSPFNLSPSYSYPSHSSEIAPSLFTTTDPFYLEQLQTSQNSQPVQNSFFSQIGRPALHSPFVMHAPLSPMQV